MGGPVSFEMLDFAAPGLAAFQEALARVAGFRLSTMGRPIRFALLDFVAPPNGERKEGGTPMRSMLSTGGIDLAALALSTLEVDADAATKDTSTRQDTPLSARPSLNQRLLVTW